MSPETRIAIRAIALQGEQASAEIAAMLRRLTAVNAGDPLPEGFIDHRLDLRSACATINRVCAALRATTAGEAAPS